MAKKILLKRILSISLCLSLLCGVYLNSFAMNNEDNTNTNQLLSICEETKYEDVYETPNGELMILIGDELLEATETPIDFSDNIEMEAFYSDETIPEEVRESVYKEYQKAIDLGYEDSVSASMFETEVTEIVVKESNQNPNSRGVTITHTYDGHNMKSYRVSYSGLNTGYKKLDTGTYARSTANSITNVVLSVVSAATSSVTLGLVSVGKSLLDLFIAEHGSSHAIGSTSDFLEMRLIYGKTDQWTYTDIAGTWYLGLATQYVNISQVDFSQYYYNSNTNKGETTDTQMKNLNKAIYSEHYFDPWETAYLRYNNPDAEWLQVYYKGISYSF